MKVKLDDPVQYSFRIGEDLVPANELVGRSVSILFMGKIICLGCGKETKRSFSQGYCYDCFISSPETAECIVRPELCLAHEGKGRDVQWEQEHHLQEHTVYLALSSHLKVGVTRNTQIPTRWIDQGAAAAIKVARTPYRQLAGQIEVELKQHFSDKTSWQKMLKNEVVDIDLVEEKWKAEELLPYNLRSYFSSDDSITRINYPVKEYPKKVSSIDLDKNGKVGPYLLQGIKGQYLLFEGGRVINVRRFGGYVVKVGA